MTLLNASPSTVAEALESARLLQREVANLIGELENGELPSAHGCATTARDQAAAIATGLESLTHAREPDPAHRYRDPLHDRTGDKVTNLRKLSAHEVREFCRYWEWARRHHQDPYGRWWISKYVSMGRRELIRRDLDPISWEDELGPNLTNPGGAIEPGHEPGRSRVEGN